MGTVKSGTRYEFNFGGVDFSNGIRVIEVNATNADGETVNLLANIPEDERPVLKSKNDFIELLVMLQISSSFVEAELGKFIGHSDMNLNGDGGLVDGITFLLGVGIVDEEVIFKLYSNGDEPEVIS